MVNNKNNMYLCGVNVVLTNEYAHQGTNEPGSGHLLFGKIIIIIYYYNSLIKYHNMTTTKKSLSRGKQVLKKHLQKQQIKTHHNIKLYYNGNITYSYNHVKKIECLISDSDRIKKKTYKLKQSHYRKISSSAAYMAHNKKNEILFLTFTLKQNVKDTSITNKAWSEYTNYLTKKYNLHAYIWVAEQQKRGAVHYHTLMDIPYTDFNVLKQQFARIFKKHNIEVSSKNSISISKKHGAIVKNTEQAVRYITKYMSKQVRNKEYKFSGRNYAISNNVNIKPITITKEEFEKILITVMAIHKFEYCETYICDMTAAIEIFDKQKRKSLPISKTWFDPRYKEMPNFYQCENMEPMYKSYV